MKKKIGIVFLLLQSALLHAQSAEFIEGRQLIESSLKLHTTITYGVHSPRAILSTLKKEIEGKQLARVGLNARTDKSAFARLEEMNLGEIGKSGFEPIMNDMCRALNQKHEITVVAGIYEQAVDAEEESIEYELEIVKSLMSARGFASFKQYEGELQKVTRRTRVDWIGLSQDVPNYVTMVFDRTCKKRAGEYIETPTLEYKSNNSPDINSGH